MLSPDYTVIVKPAPERRVAFARWATRQDPKVKTVSVDEFAVPSRLFILVPEELLIASYIDGSPYRHVEDEMAERDAMYHGVEPEADPGPFVDADESHTCADCGAPFATARGLTRHRSRKH